MKRNQVAVATLFALLVLTTTTSMAEAGIIAGVKSINDGTMGTGDGDVANLIDQSGIALVDQYTAEFTDFDDYLNNTMPTHDGLNGTNGWSSPFPPIATGFIEIEFESLRSLTALALVAEGGFSTERFTRVEVFASTDGSTFDSVDTFSLGSELTFQRFDFTSATSATHIRLDLDPDSVLGQLGEVIFEADALDANPVPEPATIAIWSLIGGVGLIGYRRRKMSKKA